MKKQDAARSAIAGIISHYALKPHPEGGFYSETYRSDMEIPKASLPAGFTGKRNVATAILYLLEEKDFSAFHRIRQDEIWHFYLGGTLELVTISPEGVLSGIRMGTDAGAGEFVQYTVPAGYWFGARPQEGAGFSFVGCTVSPGFDFDDFELGQRESLVRLFPQHEKIITALTRNE